jgi:DSF synthase
MSGTLAARANALRQIVMALDPLYQALPASDFPHWSFPTLDIDYDADSCSIWMSYKADGPPFYSLQTLIDMAAVRESLRGLFASPRIELYPIRYFVMASNKPGVFNLGGDLATFARSIREGDEPTLRQYAHLCIDVVFGLANAFDLPVVTLSVIAGQALGGGLEAALALDFLIAEEAAKIGAPESAFNTFPGMGAVSLLTRRLGQARAEELIASGKVHSGAEMGAIDVVDLVVPNGASRQLAQAWMLDGGEAHYQRRLALAKARRKLFPVQEAELIAITDLWVDCCLAITPHDIRHMERLAAAQEKMLARRE